MNSNDMTVKVLEARGSAGQAASANALRLLLEGSTQAVRSAAGGWVDGWTCALRSHSPCRLRQLLLRPLSIMNLMV
jgi:hypothetical protein